MGPVQREDLGAAGGVGCGGSRFGHGGRVGARGGRPRPAPCQPGGSEPTPCQRASRAARRSARTFGHCADRIE